MISYTEFEMRYGCEMTWGRNIIQSAGIIFPCGLFLIFQCIIPASPKLHPHPHVELWNNTRLVILIWEESLGLAWDNKYCSHCKHHFLICSQKPSTRYSQAGGTSPMCPLMHINCSGNGHCYMLRVCDVGWEARAGGTPSRMFGIYRSMASSSDENGISRI